MVLQLLQSQHGFRTEENISLLYYTIKYFQMQIQGSALGAQAGGSQVRNPIPLKIRRVWGLLHAKSYVVAKRPPVGVARKFGEGGASSGVVLVI
ncbi:hypothetical protein AVEN_44338-1 [Araneus ventricosus]|uniref:Uncharacterized protein n=1 Tax=Araneus ventricosus TaxID=182803 RepID=A0A4Y2Q0U9_ARAVE|nr:hypothetical protein AVEN_44338-1 [Araneus ventricosus]